MRLPGLPSRAALPPVNPVLARELKERMRSRRTPVVITVYLLALTAVLWTASGLAQARTTRCINAQCFTEVNPLAAATLGRVVFQTLLFVSLMLVCFIVPGLASGAVAGERERQTLLPLQVTLLRPRSIVIGKLLAALAFVALLVVAMLPLVSASFWVGGVAPGEVFKGLAMVLVTGVVLAALSVACSAWARRVQWATVAAYAAMFFLTIGTGMVYAAQAASATRNPLGFRPPSPLVLYLNPFVATADVVRGEPGAPDAATPFSPLQALLSAAHDHPGAFARPDGAPQGEAGRGRGVPPWMLSLLAYAGITAGSVALASRRLRTPAEGAP